MEATFKYTHRCDLLCDLLSKSHEAYKNGMLLIAHCTKD